MDGTDDWDYEISRTRCMMHPTAREYAWARANHDGLVAYCTLAVSYDGAARMFNADLYELDGMRFLCTVSDARDVGMNESPPDILV